MASQYSLARILAILVAALAGLITGQKGGAGGIVVIVVISTTANVAATPVLASVPTSTGGGTAAARLSVFARFLAASPTIGNSMQ